MNTVKYTAFGKVKRKGIDKVPIDVTKSIDSPKDKAEEWNKHLLEKQRTEIEEELKQVENIKVLKGKTAAVFNVLNKVRGQKKEGPEMVAMKDPDTDELIFDPKALKTASINYCVKLLQNSEVDPDYEKEIYIENLIHYLRSKEECVDDDDDLDYSDFMTRLKTISGKHSDKYKFLLKAGQGYRNSIFKLFQQVWKTERKPGQWRNTIIIQLFKGKGEISDYNCQRNLHTKEYVPKCFEGIIVDKSKDKIVANCSKFQIGGMPKHRSQENLFSVKSVLALYSMLDLPLYMQVFDISKYFDKEILKDAMDTLYKCGIKGKLYRLWYEMYRDSQIRVKTASGLTEIKTTGENVTQGSIGGAILSSANLDKTLCSYFGGSDSELSYGDKRLAPITFQDDTMRMVGSLEAAQKGNTLMEAAMKRKQLQLNISKCSIIIFQKGKKIQSVREAINKQKCLKICNQDILVKEKDDYLGDVLHEGGLPKCVEATVAKRFGRIFCNIIEISSILEDYRIETIGGLKSGLDIFEMAILPSLLNNSDVWVGIDESTVNRLESLQNKMFRQLFAVPDSTPIPMLRFDLGCLTMKERIDMKKLNFIQHLKTLEKESLAAEIYQLQAKYNFPGLVSECRELMILYELLNIIDEKIVLSKQQWKKMVKDAIKRKSEINLHTNFQRFQKLRNKNYEEDDLAMKPYVQDMKLREARTFFRIRSSMIPAKMNMKCNQKFAEQLWKCDDCWSMDSQCPAYAPLREGKNLSSDLDLVHYYQAVTKLREEKDEN